MSTACADCKQLRIQRFFHVPPPPDHDTRPYCAASPQPTGGWNCMTGMPEMAYVMCADRNTGESDCSLFSPMLGPRIRAFIRRRML